MRSRAKPHILIIGGGYPQLCIIEAARRRDAWIAVVDDREVPGCELADEVLRLHRYDARAIARATRSRKFDAIVSAGADKSVWIASALCAIRGLPNLVSPQVAKWPMRKAALRQRLAAHAIPCPASQHLSHHADFSSLRLSLPWVVKPDDGIAQTAVTKVETLEEARAAVDAALACSRSGHAVVEEFVAGRELDVNAIVDSAGTAHLLSVGYRESSRAPGSAFGVAMQKSVPADLSSAQRSALTALLQRAGELFRLKSCPLYAQAMQCDDAFSFIEIMPRLGGGEDPRIVELVTGFRLSCAVVAAALGEPIAMEKFAGAPRAMSATGAFITGDPGVFCGLDGFPVAETWVGYQAAYAKPGDLLPPLSSSHERLGIVVALGDTLEQSRARARSARATVRAVTR